MSQVKDPKIKLFGKTIQVPDNFPAPAAESGGTSCESVATAEDRSNQDPACTSDSMLEDSNFNRDAEEQESPESTAELDHRFRESVRIIVPSLSGPKHDHAKEEERAKPMTEEELNDSDIPSADSDDGSMKMSKTEQDQSETSKSQDKTLKKPDKILPCPRCNSMDTKFCYFNNYNVNQPRHFCKNCQRYWTAGGTMRNVPVGAGRRKNKNSVPQFRHLTVPEPLPNGVHHPALNPKGTVLTFGSDTPLCESMASVLNIVDKNGFRIPEENGERRSSSSNDEAGKTRLPEMVQNCHPFPPQMPCYPGAPWPYPWNPVQWGPPAFYSTAPPYWGCAVPGSWNIPWVIPPNAAASQGHHTPPSSAPNSPTLGKHLRDDNNLKLDSTKEDKALKESSSDKCLWFPKTLRIDDPGEAAKSSIWATLGIKNDSVVGGGLFEPFQAQSKGDEKTHVLETSTVLQANPAAFSRSLSFHERS